MSEVQVTHPSSGDQHTVEIPDGHDGSRVKVEFPDGETAFTEGFDPAERAIAGERPTVPCGNCGEPQVLTSADFQCSACGARNQIELRASDETADSDELTE